MISIKTVAVVDTMLSVWCTASKILLWAEVANNLLTKTCLLSDSSRERGLSGACGKRKGRVWNAINN